MTPEEYQFLRQLTEKVTRLEKLVAVLASHETTAYPGDAAIEALGDARYGQLAATNAWTGTTNTFKSATFPPLRAERTSTQTSQVRTAQSIKHTTTADMLDGFGTGFAFELNDNGLSGTNIIGEIDGVRDGGDTSGKVVVRAYNAGSPVDVAHFVKEQRVGLGAQSSPQATLDALQATLGSAVYRYASTATNDDPTETGYQNRVATTNATVTTLHTVTIPSATTVMIDAVVIARRTGGSAGTANDSAGYVVRALVKDVSGTATLVGAVSTPFSAEDVAGYDCTIDTSGATARVRVTGIASTNITWHGHIRTWALST